MTDLESLISRLGKVHHFSNLPQAALRDIVLGGQILSYPSGSVIFQESEPAAGLYVLLKGQVTLCKVGLRGNESIISIILPVIMFNEVTVIDGKPNPLTAITDQACIVWQISYESYQILLRRYPVLGTGLLQMLAARNRLMLKLYDDLISRPVLSRVAKILLDLSKNGQEPINRYKHPNHLLAGLAATVPEAVSRSMKILKTKAIIDCSRSQIKILLPQMLTDIAKVEPIVMGPIYLK